MFLGLERVARKIAALYSKKQKPVKSKLHRYRDRCSKKEKGAYLYSYFAGTFKFEVKLVPVVMDNDVVLFCCAEWLMSNFQAILCQEKAHLNPGRVNTSFFLLAALSHAHWFSGQGLAQKKSHPFILQLKQTDITSTGKKIKSTLYFFQDLHTQSKQGSS